MFRTFLSFTLLGFCLFALGQFSSRVNAQEDEAKKAAYAKLLKKAQEEYLLFFRKPKTPFEFWGAIDFEIRTGKFDVAALLIDGLVKLMPKDKTDEELLKIEEVKGMSAFLNLATVKKWNDNPDLQMEAEKNVTELVDRITSALEKKLSDPVRMAKLIKQLEAPTIEERAYAFNQLKRSKFRAAPYLVDALVATSGKPSHERIKSIMLMLDAEILPPMLEVLKASDDVDYKETDLRLTILSLMRLREETEAIPYLWHMMSSPKYPLVIRSAAQKTLASLLKLPEDKLQEPTYALTQLAEKYYKHQIHFPHVIHDPKSETAFIKFWPWTKGQQLARQPQLKSVTEAEYFFALRHAREALDLDPNYKPAQKLMLNLILEHTYAKSLDQFLLKPMPAELQTLLAGLDSELLMEVLNKAMSERNIPVILPLVQALGDRGEFKAALPSQDGSARGLLKALYFPDRRVQLASVRAMLSIPGEKSAVVQTRIMDILQRFLLTEPTPKALVIGTPEGQETAMRDAVKKAGFEPVLVSDRKQAFASLHHSADFDVIVINHSQEVKAPKEKYHVSFPTEELPFFLSALRADSDAGLLPVLILAPPKIGESLKPIVAKYHNVFVTPDGLTAVPAAFKKEIEQDYKLSHMPTFIADVPGSQRPRIIEDILNTKGIELSAAERKQLSSEAMSVLWIMGRGGFKGFSLQPAKKAIQEATRSKDLAEKAIESLGYIPGTDVQQQLVSLFLDNALDKKLRFIAGSQLHQHILKNGMVLNQNQIAELRAAQITATDPAIRQQIAVLLTHVPATTDKTGQKLGGFNPAPLK